MTAHIIKITNNFMHSARANRKVVASQKEAMYRNRFAHSCYHFENGYAVDAEYTKRGYICKILKDDVEIAGGWFYVSHYTGNTHIQLIPRIGWFNVALGPCNQAIYDAVTALGERNYRNYIAESKTTRRKPHGTPASDATDDEENETVVVWDDDNCSETEIDTGDDSEITEQNTDVRSYVYHVTEFTRPAHFRRLRNGVKRWFPEQKCHPRK